jgi:hypothetical protein
MSARAVGYKLQKDSETGLYWVRYRVNGRRVSQATGASDPAEAARIAREIVEASGAETGEERNAPAPQASAPSPMLPLLTALLAMAIGWFIYEFSYKPSVRKFERPATESTP